MLMIALSCLNFPFRDFSTWNSVEKSEVFADAVARLKEVAETLPPRISCRASPEGGPHPGEVKPNAGDLKSP